MFMSLADQVKAEEESNVTTNPMTPSRLFWEILEVSRDDAASYALANWKDLDWFARDGYFMFVEKVMPKMVSLECRGLSAA